MAYKVRYTVCNVHIMLHTITNPAANVGVPIPKLFWPMLGLVLRVKLTYKYQ